MNKYINQLLQIQDLEVALRENSIMCESEKDNAAYTQLKKNIKSLESNLSDDILAVYRRISKRYDISVCPMINNTCTGCFLKLPLGVANAVTSDSQCISCPNCHRFLFYEKPKEIKKLQEPSRYKGIARFSSVELMMPHLEAKTIEEVIKKIGQSSAKAGFVENGDDFIKALLKRESLVSTVVGSGIAFPHARGIHACGLTLAVGTVKSGIYIRDEPVYLFFVSAVPIPTGIFYLEIISKLVRYFGKKSNVDKMLECSTPEEMWNIFTKIGK